MSFDFIDRLWRQPQGIWARKALFQVHLWAGIGAGIYILLISVSGSLVVFRTELHRAFTRPPVTVVPAAAPLSDAELKAAVERAYPGWEIDQVWPPKRPEQPVEIWMKRGGRHKQRIFNPYTGADLGHNDPAGVRMVLWLVSFHDDLLVPDKGRKANGIGAILLTVLCVTGAIIWWPGAAKWRGSVTAPWTGNWKRFNWALHSAAGLWSFAFVFLWAVSGIYLVFPETFSKTVDYLQPLDENAPTARLGDEILRWVARLHFGRFAGWPVKTLWVVLGLAPVALFITGAVMWWNRKIKSGAGGQRGQTPLAP